MKILGTIVAAVVLVIGIATATAFAMNEAIKPEVYSWRYKITVEVETPEGVKSGSAVREVRAYLNNQKIIPPLPAVEYETIGEAVVVDLAGRGLLFALIDWDSYREVFNALPYEAQDTQEIVNYYSNLKFNTRNVLSRDLPRILYYEDISDPSSAKLVYKSKEYANGNVHIDNFQEIFGDEFSLKNVEIEIVDQAITKKIEPKLVFLKSIPKFIEFQNSLKYRDPKKVSRDNFISVSRYGILTGGNDE